MPKNIIQEYKIYLTSRIRGDRPERPCQLIRETPLITIPEHTYGSLLSYNIGLVVWLVTFASPDSPVNSLCILQQYNPITLKPKILSVDGTAFVKSYIKK